MRLITPRTSKHKVPSKRLEALRALHATADERIGRNPGFLESIGPEGIAAYLASDAPEMIGTGPRRKNA